MSAARTEERSWPRRVPRAEIAYAPPGCVSYGDASARCKMSTRAVPGECQASARRVPGTRLALAGTRSPEELVAEAVDGDDELRRPGMTLDLLPQPRDVDVHRARQRHLVVPPHVGQQLLARQRLAAPIDEVPQQLELARRQIDRHPT